MRTTSSYLRDVYIHNTFLYLDGADVEDKREHVYNKKHFDYSCCSVIKSETENVYKILKIR